MRVVSNGKGANKWHGLFWVIPAIRTDGAGDQAMQIEIVLERVHGQWADAVTGAIVRIAEERVHKHHWASYSGDQVLLTIGGGPSAIWVRADLWDKIVAAEG